MNPKKLARLTGVIYLFMFPLGIFGILYVPANILVSGDTAATASNILSSEGMFRLSIVCALLIQVVQIFLVLALYKLLKPAGKTVAVVMLVLILAAVPIAMLNEGNHLAVLVIVKGGLALDQPIPLMSLFLRLHEYGVNIAQIFWGLWLFPMGLLVYRSGYLPRIIGVLLMIGCFGYLADSFLSFVLPDFGLTFAEYTSIGELLLPLWLLIKGVDAAKWEERAANPA